MSDAHPLLSFLADIRTTLATGANTKETSFYPALRELLNAAGRGLSPQVVAVMNLKNQGGGLPDGGLFGIDQFPKNLPGVSDELPVGLKPSRGAIEVKGLNVELSKLIASEQVARYLKTYGHVLVTNLRSFALVQAGASPSVVESFDLADDEPKFKALLSAHDKIRVIEPRFLDFLRRVLRLPAPLRDPADVAWFLASYARDALHEIEQAVVDKPVPELDEVAGQLGAALGISFGFEPNAEGGRLSAEEARKQHHFFVSVLVQTLFYGVFSAWVLWCRQPKGATDSFSWTKTSYVLRLPLLQKLFHDLTQPSTFFARFVQKKLELAQDTLNRVDQSTFFATFREHEAVQYFYEPFLEAFDPELRKEMGVWYTPDEIVRYMVERVDRSLREDLGIEKGLASEDVCVLDPCCGTGAFLVAVLDRIHRTFDEQGEGGLAAALVAKAAAERIFGFELLPASFVVAHLQIGLYLQEIGTQLPEGQRAAVYLTNALTGWNRSTTAQQKLWGALKQERADAERVKQKTRILVVLGNPPYNAFAGVQPREEQESVDLYKEGLVKLWKIKKFNLDDLYVRFLRVAERKILEGSGEGIVCFISNASYLTDKSFVVLRERFAKKFDRITIDNLNGDSFETGKLTPSGQPDPSVFSTPRNPEGIRVGTAVVNLVRTSAKQKPTHRAYIRWRDFWGKTKRADLLASLEDKLSAYSQTEPSAERSWSFRPAVSSGVDYFRWPRVTELCLHAPISGLSEQRSGVLIAIDPDRLRGTMISYFDSKLDWKNASDRIGALAKKAGRFEPSLARSKILASGEVFRDENIMRYSYIPMDNRYCYHSTVRPLWAEPRNALVAQLWDRNRFFITRTKARRPREGNCAWSTSALPDYHMLDPNVVAIPLRWRSEVMGQVEERANLSEAARVYLAGVGLFEPDDDEEAATRLWHHALAISFSPAWMAENGPAIREDFPRVPLPVSRAVLKRSAELGKLLADLVDPDIAVSGVTTGKLRAELKPLGELRRVSGSVDPAAGDLAVKNRWGNLQRETVVMPGPGKTTEATDAALGEHVLGPKMLDVWLNDRVFLHAVPEAVWDFTVGGYQVIKKWLSYREQAILGRDLTLDEARHLSAMVRRIAAILLLSDELDEVYQASRDASVPWASLLGPAASKRYQFIKLALSWTQETAALSSMSASYAHRSYEQILQLGGEIVPDILRWIAQGGPGYWGDALARLSGEQPDLKKATNPAEIHELWVRWGQAQGLLEVAS